MTFLPPYNDPERVRLADEAARDNCKEAILFIISLRSLKALLTFAVRFLPKFFQYELATAVNFTPDLLKELDPVRPYARISESF